MQEQHAPTLPEIAAACEQIQATWNEATRTARIADDRVRNEATRHYTVPEIPAAYLISELEE